VKSGRGKGEPIRERPYWEPPQSSVGRIEAHIEEIGGDAPEPGPEPTLRHQLSQELWKRRAVVVVAACVVVALAALQINGPTPKPASTPAPVPSGSQYVAELPSDSPPASQASIFVSKPYEPVLVGTPQTWTFVPYPTDTPDSTPQPIVAKGWPLAIDHVDTRDGWNASDLVVGPNGSVYVSGAPALDSTGHQSKLSLLLPNGDYAEVQAFASDGTVYATDEPDSGPSSDGSVAADDQPMIYAFGADGKTEAGWPVAIGSAPLVQLGPAGSVFVLSDADSVTTARMLTSDGKTKASWTLGSDSDSCDEVLRADGTFFYAYSTTDENTACSIAVFSPTGAALTRSPERGWDSLSIAADGAVVAVGYDMEPYSATTVAQTRVAVIGDDGHPKAGWPVTLQGAASPPAFGADGTIYLSQAGLGTTPSQVTAYDYTGNLKAGWPVQLPVGYGPFTGDSSSSTPQPPVVGDDGTVYAAATKNDWTGLVVAFDTGGNPVPGWPAALPQAFAAISGEGVSVPDTNPGPMFVTSPSGPGSLVLMLEGEIVALGRDGKIQAGWPYLIPDSSDEANWLTWAATPDGGIVVVSEVDGTDDTVDTIVRLTPTGTVAR
jgi:hypothetical protein